MNGATSAAHAYHFTDRGDLLNWMSENRNSITVRRNLFCVVFDPKYSEIFNVRYIFDFLHHAPKICISRPAHLAKALRTINTGLFDFIEKPFRLDSMRKTLDQAFLRHEQESLVNTQFASLTKRERETCELIANGLTSKDISEKLEISIKTVKVHRANLMRKMQAKSVTDLLHAHNMFKSIHQEAIVNPKTTLFD